MNEIRRTPDGGWEITTDDGATWEAVTLAQLMLLFGELSPKDQMMLRLEAQRTGLGEFAADYPGLLETASATQGAAQGQLQDGAPQDGAPQDGGPSWWPRWAGPYPPMTEVLGKRVFDQAYYNGVLAALRYEKDIRPDEPDAPFVPGFRDTPYGPFEELSRGRFTRPPSPNIPDIYRPSLQQQIADALARGDEEQAVRLLEFSQRPSDMEMFNSAMEMARSPVDSLTLAAMQRGELPIQGTPGAFERIGPINPFLEAAWGRLMSQRQPRPRFLHDYPVEDTGLGPLGGRSAPGMGQLERDLDGVNEFPAWPAPGMGQLERDLDPFRDYPVEDEGLGPLGGLPRPKPRAVFGPEYYSAYDR